MLESWKLWLEFAADTTHSYDELLLDHLTGKVCRDGRFPNSSFLLNDCDHRNGELG